jgi:hypothetical protein
VRRSAYDYYFFTHLHLKKICFRILHNKSQILIL